MSGPRSICHIREGARVIENEVGVLLSERACCHASISSLPEDDEKGANKIRSEALHGCELVLDNGLPDEEHEKEYSSP